MNFRESDVPLMHPLALQTARMFAVAWCRDHEMPHEAQQELANRLGAQLHVMFEAVEEMLGVSAKKICNENNTPLMLPPLLAYVEYAKLAIRVGIVGDWSNDEGGEPVPIVPFQPTIYA